MFDALERFVLLDVEGILLDNPGDELPIVEPVGFRDLLMTIQRDEEYRGMTTEFGEGETELGFDWNKEEGEDYSGHELVKAVIEASGSDGKVFLRYYRTEDGVETLEYEWILILKSAEEEDAVFFVRVKKEDFGDKLRTRFDTDINVAGTKDLDDTTVAACPMITLPLHSRVLRQRVVAANTGVRDIDIPVVNNFTKYGLIGFGNPSINEIESYRVFTDQILGDESAPELGYETLTTSYKSDITIEIADLAYVFFVELLSSINVTSLSFKILADVYTLGNDLVSTSELYTKTVVPGITDTPTISATIDETYEITLPPDRKLYLYWELTMAADTPSVTDTGTLEFQLGSFNLTEETTAPPSTIEGNFIFEVLEDSLKKAIGGYKGQLITATVGAVSGGPFQEGEIVLATSGEGYGTILSIDGSTYIIQVEIPFTLATIEGQTSGATGGILSIEYPNILDSSLLAKTENTALTDGVGSLNFVTTGKRIRQLPAPPLNVTCAKLIDFTRCRYNAGFMIREESDGSSTVVVEEASTFFNDVKIITLPNVQNSTKRLFNNDLLYNEFEAGYTKYAKENENNSIEGFNTKRSWLLPIEKDKKKLSLIAPVITDGAEIERVRRLEINQDESDQSDDEVFIIKCQRFNSTNRVKNNPGIDQLWLYPDNTSVTMSAGSKTIILNGFYLNGQATDATTITVGISSLSSIPLVEGTYTIDSVTYDADNNRTTFVVDEVPAFSGTFSFYAFNFDVDFFLPERLESFNPAYVSGVVDKYTEYNIDHSPLTFLFYWFNFLGATLETKAGTKKIKFTTGVNNNDISKRYKSGVGLTTTQMDEDQDWLLSSLRTYNPAIFTQFAWEVKSIMPFAQWKQVRQSLLGMVTPSSNYGYVDFYEESGNLVQIWPVKVTRNNVTEETTIIGWERNTETTGTNYILQETGDKIYRESSTGFLLRESAGSLPESGIIETEDGGGFLTEDGGFFELEG